MKKCVFLFLLLLMISSICLGLTSCQNNNNHSHELSHINAKSATCVQEGMLEHWYCSSCEKYFKNEDATSEVPFTELLIPATGTHRYGDWSVVSEPSCVIEGEKKKICSECGHEVDEPISATGHVYVNDYICTTCGFELSETNGLSFQKSVDGNYYSVIGIGSANQESEIVIPFSVDGIPVKCIAVSAFKNERNIKEVVIPSSVERIETTAFEGCSNLSKVTFLDGVKEFGAGAFWECSSLTEITIPQSVEKIGGSAFYGCTRLCKIYYNATCAQDLKANDCIFENTGMYNSDMTQSEGISVIIGSCVERIPANLFRTIHTGQNSGSVYSETYQSRIVSVTFEADSKCTSVGSGAFYMNKRLKKVSYNNKIDDWAMIAFEDSSSNPISFAKSLHIDNVKVTDVKLSSATLISNYSFFGCEDIANLDIGDSVLSVGEYAFDGCTSLKSITIGRNVNKLNKNAFAKCSSLTSLHFNAVEMCDLSNDSFVFAYSGDDGFSVTIDACVVRIPAYLFHAPNDSNKQINQIIFEENSKLQSIGVAAFYKCKNDTLIYYSNPIDDWAMIEFGSYSSNPLFYTNNFYVGEQKVTEVHLTTATKVSDYAFYNYRNLTKLTLPIGLTDIGTSAFYNCTSLVSINYDAENMVDLTADDRVFEGAGVNGNGIIVTIGNQVRKLPNYLFCAGENSPNIQNVYFKDDSVCSSIGDCTFAACRSLTTIILPKNVKTIGVGAFRECENLSSVTMPDGLDTIESSAFYNCPSLREITIPRNVQELGDKAFACCSTLEKINFNSIQMHDLTSTSQAFLSAGQNGAGIDVFCGEDVLKIPSYLFAQNKYIKSIIFENDGACTSINTKAFEDCSALKDIKLSDNIAYISDDAFDGCNSLEYKEYEGCSYLGNDNNPYIVLVKANDNNTSYAIHDDTTIIFAYAFYNHTQLESASLPTNIKHIGSYAFYNCTSWTTEVINSDVLTRIGSYAFYNCKNLSGDLVLSDSVTDVGKYAFYGCSDIESLNVGKNIQSIGEAAFRGCHGLKTIVVSNQNANYHSIGNCLIKTSNKTLLLGCNNSILEEDNDIIAIDGCAFWNCSDLKSLCVPNSVVSIGGSAFSGCSSLESINIPDGVSEISRYMFADCIALKNISLNEGLLSIGERAFANCGIQHIELPSTVDFIDEFAFCDSKLQTANIGRGWTRLFYNYGYFERLRFKDADLLDEQNAAKLLKITSADYTEFRQGDFYGDWIRDS